jgi:cbb3-type cytochrome c oxidase subunit III
MPDSSIPPRHSARSLARAAAGALLGALTVLAVLPAPAATPETQTAKMYMEYCSVCHGDKGDGKSHARQGLRPPPRDFTTGDVRRQLSREHMIAVVKDGKPGTAMVGWGTRLSDEQIEGLVDYIRERFMPAFPEAEAGTSPGGQIYAKTCSVCHGEDGAGALWGKTSLHPPPVNFTAADRQQELPRERMIMSVTHGRPGTAMTAFASQLSATEIEAVVDYIRDAFMKDKETGAQPAASRAQAATTVGMAVLHGKGQYSDDGQPAGARADLPLPHELSGDAAAGKAYYLLNCTACHGEDGDGNGPRAYFIFPKPRNFLHPASRARLNRPTLFTAIRQGVAGREMPAWSKVFTDQQIADVTEYVFQTFIRPGESEGELPP